MMCGWGCHFCLDSLTKVYKHYRIVSSAFVVTVLLVIFSRDLFRFFCESRAICETVKFGKVKTAKFWLSTCKVNEPHFSPSYSIYIATKRSVSVSVPLMANTVAIQEIKVLCKHRHVRLSTVSMNALV